MTEQERPPHVQAEMDGMNAVPDGGEPWTTLLKPPHPAHIAKAAGAVTVVTTSLRQAYMVAYTLDSAGLLAEGAAAERTAQAVAAELLAIAGHYRVQVERERARGKRLETEGAAVWQQESSATAAAELGGVVRYLEARATELSDGTPAGPPIVCLSGSMRYAAQMAQVAGELTGMGVIVLMPHVTVHDAQQSGERKRMLDELHRAKIRMAHRLVVVSDESGYYGDSTRAEIEYAAECGLGIAFASADLTADDAAVVERVKRALAPLWAPLAPDLDALARAAVAAVKEQA